MNVIVSPAAFVPLHEEMAAPFSSPIRVEGSIWSTRPSVTGTVAAASALANKNIKNNEREKRDVMTQKSFCSYP